jgi:hypothetical protein
MGSSRPIRLDRVSPYQLGSRLFQEFLNGYRAFADGGGDASYGAGADVAAGEDAATAGLEMERLAFEFQRGDSGANEAFLVFLDPRRESIGPQSCRNGGYGHHRREDA